MRESLNKTTVEVCKTQEGLYFLLAIRCWPFRNPCDLYWVHLRLSMRDDEAQVFNLSPCKLALVMSEIEFVLSESFQYQTCDSVMLFHRLCKDEDVIQVDTDHTLSDEILENVIHHGLEGGWAVSETEEHHQRFEESSVGAECSLPFITFLDTDIVVPPLDIQLGEVSCASETIDKVRNERKRIDILDSLCIECPIVLDKSERSSFFLMKNTGAAMGDLEGQIRPDARFSSM